jgi:voltage-gated potassium channel
MGLWHEIRRAVLLLLLPVVVGTAGYTLLGLSLLDALYQTVTTVATVGYGEIDGPYGPGRRAFGIALIALGVASAFYAAGVLVKVLVERRIQLLLAERRMSKRIAELSGHVVVCGLGRVGRTIAAQVARAGRDVVVIDRELERVADSGYAHVAGDATDDAVLQAAGVDRAVTLVAALDNDAANLYVALSARALNPKLFIVARARDENADTKLLQAGADRVVNPQRIGGDRMAALTLQPNVAEFLEVVNREGGLEFRLEELVVEEGSELSGASLRDAHIRDRTGALILALRDDVGFTSNPDPATVLRGGIVMIAIGTRDQLDRLSTISRKG